MTFIFTFHLWDGRNIDIASRSLGWAMESAMNRGIFLEDIDTIRVREKC